MSNAETNLFICSTLNDLLVATHMATSRYKHAKNILALINTNSHLINGADVLSSWTDNPFLERYQLDKHHIKKPAYIINSRRATPLSRITPSIGSPKRSFSEQYKSITQISSLKKLIQRIDPTQVIGSPDLKSWKLLKRLSASANKFDCIAIDNGISMYYTHTFAKQKSKRNKLIGFQKQLDKVRQGLKRKTTQNSPLFNAAYSVYPHLLLSCYKKHSSTLTALHRPQENPILSSLALHVMDLWQISEYQHTPIDMLMILPPIASFDKSSAHRRILVQSLQVASFKGLNILVHYDEQETTRDPLNLSQLNNVNILPNGCPLAWFIQKLRIKSLFMPYSKPASLLRWIQPSMAMTAYRSTATPLNLSYISFLRSIGIHTFESLHTPIGQLLKSTPSAPQEQYEDYSSRLIID